MVAYNFQRQFEAQILTGSKTGTIRPRGRRRHAVPGDTLQLYTGQRTRSCRLIATTTCLSADPIRLFLHRTAVLVGTDQREIADLDAFARGDGFAGWDEMAAFFMILHGSKRLGPWRGLWIRWDPATVVPGGDHG